jgi:flagellar motor switch protein FliN/FliY
MADQAEHVDHDEIEQLLRQAADEASPAESQTAGSSQQPGAAEAAGRPGVAGGTGDAVAAAAAGESPLDAAANRSPSGDDIQLLLARAEEAIASVAEPAPAGVEGLQPFRFEDFAGTPASSDKATLDLLRDVELDLRIELGRTQMYLEDVLKLRRGSVVALDKLAGDPVDIFVNGRLIARGEVLVFNDSFCVRVAELIVGEDAA